MASRPVGSRNLGTLLRDPWLELNARLTSTVAARGFDDLRPALSVVFQHLRDEGSRITEIADRAQLTKQTVVYLVNDLEREGYVERVADPTDRRAKLVRLTARGDAAVAEARRIVSDIERDWTELLGERRMKELRRLLEALHDGLWPPESSETLHFKP
ncbi:MAG: MarR family winged helix-turn-helix transcriptional regulator [Solirubrobacteraceae bacterium]